MIDLCVIGYNTKPLLERLLKTLYSDAGCLVPFCLYIAENGSEDDTMDFLTKECNLGEGYISPYDIEHYVHFPDNPGYARAANYLASLGSSPYIGILNSDVWMRSSDVFSIVHSFQELTKKDPTVAIIGPKQRDEKGFVTHAGIFGSNTNPKHRGWHMEDSIDLQFRDVVPAVTVSGSAYFVRRDVWDTLSEDTEYIETVDKLTASGAIKDTSKYPLGPFLPTPHYYEETFCSYFARHRGYKVMYDGRVSIGHSWHASHEKGSEADRLFSVSRNIFRAACDNLGIEHD